MGIKYGGMGLNVGFLLRILEEDGSVLEEMVADIEFNPVRTGFASNDFPMLGTLDPYGDTSLNYLQCALLKKEIREVRGRMEAAGISPEFLDGLIRLCRVCGDRPHRSLVFIGD